MPSVSLPNSQRVYALTIVIALCVGVIMFSSRRGAEHMIEVYAPLVDAVMEIKL